MTARTASLVAIADSTDREAWLEARRNGVTATDVASLAGAASFRRVLADKRGELRDFRNAAMAHGTAREPRIAEWALIRFGLRSSTTLFAHPENHRHLATPDLVSERFEFDETLGEIKATKNEWDGPSTRYGRQMQWQFHVTGAAGGWFIWEQRDEEWQPIDLEPRAVWVRRDQAVIDELVEKADELLRFMDSEEPLPSPRMDALIEGYLAQKERVDAERKVLEEYERQIRFELGDVKQAKAFGSVGNLTWSTYEQDSFSSAELKKKEPETYARFVTRSERTRLSITAAKPVEKEEGSNA